MRNVIKIGIFDKVLFLLFHLLLIESCLVSADTQFVLKPFDFDDDWLDKIPVVGSLMKGIEVSVPGKKIDLNALYVRLPQTREKVLCVSLCSRDGRYVAEIKYKLDRQEYGAYRLELPTKYGPQISRYRTGDLVVVARLVDNDYEKGEKTYIPAHWGRTVDTAKELFLYLNIRNKDIRIFLSNDATSPSCRPFPPGKNMKFDEVCSLPLHSKEQVMYIDIVEYHFETRGRTESIKVFMP